MPDLEQDSKPRGPRPLNGLIHAFLKEHHLTAGGAHLAVFEAWNQSAAEQGIAHTHPVLFRKGHLSVEVASAALLQELRNFTGEGLRIKTNERLKKELIRKISFKIQG